MKRALLAAFVLFCCCPSFAQWTIASNLVVGTDTANNVYKIKGFGSSVYVCSNKGLFVSGDNGTTWTNLTFTKTNTLNKSIVAMHVDSIDGKIYAATDSMVFLSSDNGSTWSPTGAAQTKINDIDQLNNTIIISYGAFPNGGMLYSPNQLSTTTPATAPNLAYYDIQPQGGTLYVGGNGGVYKSTDNGMTWVIAGTGFATGANFRSLTMSEGVLFAGAVSGNGLYQSSDNGTTWTRSDTTVFNGFCQIFDLTSAHGTVLATMDGACNGGNPIKATTDSGATWTAYMSGLTAGFHPTLGRNSSGSCFFSFKNNDKTLYRICMSTGINGVAAEPLQPVIRPNPANDIITIDLPEAFNSVELNVISVSGQIVSSSRSTGSQISLNVGHLSQGLYYIHIRTDGRVYNVRFVKE
jgi:photosystem II stability/assembly factor-like uncharacterized protein